MKVVFTGIGMCCREGEIFREEMVVFRADFKNFICHARSRIGCVSHVGIANLEMVLWLTL